MPATITPNSTEQERKRRVEDYDHGSGRRPPNDKNDKRTGGDGEGDNYNARRGRPGPGERLSRYRTGIFLALAGDLMFFAAIVGSFFVTQASSHANVYNHPTNDWLPTAIPPVLWLNTAVLILSSVTIEIARRRMFRVYDVMDEWLGLGKPSTRAALPWLIATTMFGLLFLAGQWLAWQQLATQRAYLRYNPSSKFFYLITGVHAAHLFLGIAALIACLSGLYTSRQLETRQILVDSTAWYWHAMGILWLFLFALLAFFQ